MVQWSKASKRWTIFGTSTISPARRGPAQSPVNPSWWCDIAISTLPTDSRTLSHAPRPSVLHRCDIFTIPTIPLAKRRIVSHSPRTLSSPSGTRRQRIPGEFVAVPDSKPHTWAKFFGGNSEKKNSTIWNIAIAISLRVLQKFCKTGENGRFYISALPTTLYLHHLGCSWLIEKLT